MLAFTIEETAVKVFMNRLLREEMFDAYEVRSVEIDMLTRVEVSGELTGDTTRRFARWSQIKPLIHVIIKNGAKPRAMKVVFSCDTETNASVHENASALFLNLSYENGGVNFTTATAQKQFSMDKTLDTGWDAYVTTFFKNNGVNIQLLT